MQDIGTLSARVGQVARQIDEARVRCSDCDRSLLDILGRLKNKWEKQKEELDSCKGRTGLLEQSNAELAELISKLLSILEAGFDNESLENLKQANVIASAMLTDDTATVRLSEGDAEREACFQDVGPDVLATDAATSDDEIEALPKFVRHAVVGQQTEEFENALAQNDAPAIAAAASSPEIETSVDAECQTEKMVEAVEKNDIKAILKCAAGITDQCEDEDIEIPSFKLPK